MLDSGLRHIAWVIKCESHDSRTVRYVGAFVCEDLSPGRSEITNLVISWQYSHHQLNHIYVGTQDIPRTIPTYRRRSCFFWARVASLGSTGNIGYLSSRSSGVTHAAKSSSCSACSGTSRISTGSIGGDGVPTSQPLLKQCDGPLAPPILVILCESTPCRLVTAQSCMRQSIRVCMDIRHTMISPEIPSRLDEKQ